MAAAHTTGQPGEKAPAYPSTRKATWSSHPRNSPSVLCDLGEAFRMTLLLVPTSATGDERRFLRIPHDGRMNFP